MIINVPIPTRMKHLPKDGRGYPIPTNVFRDKAGAAHFAINDEKCRMRQAIQDRCPICDGKLFKGRWFVGGPLSAFHPNGSYFDLPLHHECATYALQVCPYLAMRNYVKRVDTRTLDPERVDERQIFIDPTMIAQKPKLFVCAMTVGQTFVKEHVRPLRPWHRIEYWRDGVEIDAAEGERIAQKVVRSYGVEVAR